MVCSCLVNLGLILTSGLVIILGALYLYFQRKYRYWSDRNVPHLKPSFPFGNLGEGTKKAFGVVFKELYDKTKNEKYYGVWQLHRPTLLVNDPDLIKRVLIGDFMSFHDHGSYVNEKDDPLQASLFQLEGAAWRNIRVKLTPAFTSGKMKMMFSILQECGDEMRDVLKPFAERKEVIEVKEIAARYATDVIASCAFGVQANSLKDSKATFRTMGRKILEPTWIPMMKSLLVFFIPDLARLAKVVLIPKDVTEFFMNAMRETMDYREANNVERKDVLQLLIQLMKKGTIDDVDSSDKNQSDKEKFTFEQAAAQAFLFFFGGFETSSTTMQYILYELALNQDIQKRLREEIKKMVAKCNGKLTYEALHEMDYLGRVIDETLRKYPPAPVLVRVCTRNTKFPEYNLTLEKGTSVMVPMFGLHMDEKHFPNPEKFDPDRFTEEAKQSRHHYAYLPFGEGPRICIGKRFAEMQTRVGIVSLLLDYQFDVSPNETPIPMEFDPRAFVLTPKGGMNLKISLFKE